MDPTLILVVPVYNEARRFDAAPWVAYAASDVTVSLLFVDDGSTDGTPAALESMRGTPRCDVCTLDRNVGKGEAVRRGVIMALARSPEYVGYLDADLAAPLSQVHLLRDALEADAGLWAAIGSRVKLLGRAIERNERRHYIGRVFATAASLALRLPVYDTQCGLKLFRTGPEVRRAFAAPFLGRWTFDVELLARLRRAAGPDAARRLREVPLEEWRERGASKVRWRDGVTAMWELARIRRAG